MVSGKVFGFVMFGRGVCLFSLDSMDPVAGGDEETFRDAGIARTIALDDKCHFKALQLQCYKNTVICLSKESKK